MRAIVADLHRRSGTVMAELGIGATVAANIIAVGGFVEIYGEGAVVGCVRRIVRCRDMVVAYLGAGLIGKGIDTAGIIQLTRIVMHLVSNNAVVPHAAFECRPAPAYANACETSLQQISVSLTYPAPMPTHPQSSLETFLT